MLDVCAVSFAAMLYWLRVYVSLLRAVSTNSCGTPEITAALLAITYFSVLSIRST